MGNHLRADKPSQYLASHPGQLSWAIPPWLETVTTSKSWGVSGHTVQCISVLVLMLRSRMWLENDFTFCLSLYFAIVGNWLLLSVLTVII